MISLSECEKNVKKFFKKFPSEEKGNRIKVYCVHCGKKLNVYIDVAYDPYSGDKYVDAVLIKCPDANPYDRTQDHYYKRTSNPGEVQRHLDYYQEHDEDVFAIILAELEM